MPVSSCSKSAATYFFEGSAGRPVNSDASRKRDGDCIVESSSRKKTIIHRSLQQDEHRHAQHSCSKQVLIDSNADRPLRPGVNARIAYIFCPRWCWRREPELMLAALEHAITVASTIINVVFDDEDDAKHLLLKDIWNDKFATLSMGAIVSLYLKDSWQLLDCKDIDPINRSPCVMLTFGSRDLTCYRLTVLAVALPALPRMIRGNVLDVCVDRARTTLSNAMIIGGVFSTNLLWFENHVRNLDFHIDISTNNDLNVLPWCDTGFMECNALESKGPFTLLIQHVQSSAERPASR